MLEVNPYLAGDYAPVAAETQRPLEVLEGEIPRDLRGTFVRNGPNPAMPPPGRYHWFDGDGMLHAVRFEDGRATYTNRFIGTEGLRRERERGAPLWRGLREPVLPELAREPYKDASNTDVKAHAGKLVTTHFLCGAPYRVDAKSLETIDVAPFAKGFGPVSAHVKVDDATGEMMIFSFGPRPPFMKYGVVDRTGALVHTADVPLPGVRLPHDMAITDRYSVLMDLNVFPDTASLAKGRWRTRFHDDVPARFHVIPRHGRTEDIRVFTASPCYIYHVVNAWDEGDSIVMDAHRVVRPFLNMPEQATELEKMLHNLRMDADLYRYRFDLRTGETHETHIDDRNTEFPSIDARVQGRKNRYAYAMDIPRSGDTLRFTGIVKYDLAQGSHTAHTFGVGLSGSESPFAPRVGAAGEDDGYLLSFVHASGASTSMLFVYDARDITRGPIAKLHVPVRVPLGFHACFADGL